jgi:hypothetical protein
MWRGLETEERQAFSEFFHPFRAEPHTFYIYCQYTNIVFILQYNFPKNVIQFNNKKDMAHVQIPFLSMKHFHLPTTILMPLT